MGSLSDELVSAGYASCCRLVTERCSLDLLERPEEPMHVFDKILVPVDFGEPSRHALEVAIDLAKQSGAALTVLHVFDVPPSYAGMDLLPTDLLAPMWAAAQEELDSTLANVKGALPHATQCMARGVPWREILTAIERTHPDLVVVGTHGRTGIERVLLGSVAEKIVRLSPVPVLTVPPARDDGRTVEQPAAATVNDERQP